MEWRIHLRENASSPSDGHGGREDDAAHPDRQRTVAPNGGALCHRSAKDGCGGRLEDNVTEELCLARVATSEVVGIDAVGNAVAKEQRAQRTKRVVENVL